MADVRHALQQLTGVHADVAASIAVLPFANLSRDVDDEYFSDGLSEEIINALTQPSLRRSAAWPDVLKMMNLA